jgi:helicase
VFHHAGLVYKQREMIEKLFISGGIKIICATPTLAMGLDLPAFRTIIKDLKRYSAQGFNYIPVMEFHQICGRAGRPGKEDYGQAISIVKTKKQRDKIVEKFIFGDPEPILSKLAVEPILRTYLLSLIATDFVSTVDETLDFFKQTFWAHQFEDWQEIEVIIFRMLRDLEEYKFITWEGKKEKKLFTDAIDLVKKTKTKEKLEATILGKRVAELYLDPLTAHKIITELSVANIKGATDFSFLNSICGTLEMRPLIRVKTTEYDKMILTLSKYENQFLEDMPEEFDEEFYDFLSVFKTSLLLKDWIEEKDEEFILGKFGVRPGELNVKITNANWLLYSAEELARLSNNLSLLSSIKRLRTRVKYGVKEELLTLLKLENIGRARARKLHKAGLTDIGKIRKIEINKLVGILGKKIALKVKEQLGEKYDETKVKEQKRGQQSLMDY